MVQSNEHMSKEFLLERGLRQGWSLFFWSGSITYGKTIPVKKQNCKLSQYADDTNINLSNFEDIDKCLKCQKATGCTLNASKTNSSLI